MESISDLASSSVTQLHSSLNRLSEVEDDIFVDTRATLQNTFSDGTTKIGLFRGRNRTIWCSGEYVTCIKTRFKASDVEQQ